MEEVEREEDFPYENLVLEGGGAKGFAYLGAIQELEQQGRLARFRRFAGASAGAILASLLALGADCQTLKKLIAVPLLDIAQDACCSSVSVLRYIPMINNVLRRYGWNTGDSFTQYMSQCIEHVWGDPNVTFGQLYDRTGRELCVSVTNVTRMEIQFFHPKLTPDVPIVTAVRMSMSLPGYFEPVRYNHHGLECMFVDGGLLCNYPIHCFDGWYLSMKPEDAFLERLGINDYQSPFSPRCDKTLGMVVYSAVDHDVMKPYLHHRYEDFPTTRPNSPLSRKREDKVLQALENIEEHNTLLEVSKRVGKVIVRAHQQTKADALTREDFLQIMNQIGEKDYEHLTGCDFNPEASFEKLQKETEQVTFSGMVRYLDRMGFFFRELHEGSLFRAQIDSAPSFFKTLLDAVGLTTNRYYVKKEDVFRTVGINTDYLQTLDFDISELDRQFLLKQGANAMKGFLRERTSGSVPPQGPGTEQSSGGINTHLEEMDVCCNP